MKTQSLFALNFPLIIVALPSANVCDREKHLSLLHCAVPNVICRGYLLLWFVFSPSNYCVASNSPTIMTAFLHFCLTIFQRQGAQLKSDKILNVSGGIYVPLKCIISCDDKVERILCCDEIKYFLSDILYIYSFQVKEK